MSKLIDLTGQRFGRLTVLARDPATHKCSSYWICICDCGNRSSVSSQSLRNGVTTSCGCYQREATGNANRTHGKTKTRLYHVWESMRRRCNCNSDGAFKYYGGKGIKICDEWNDFEAFEKWAYENGYDPNAKSFKCTIDRIDNSKGYSPENCRWVDSIVQANNHTTNVKVSYNGETKTIAEWSKLLGWNYRIVYDRIVKYGWKPERAFTQQPRDWGPGRCRDSG